MGLEVPAYVPDLNSANPPNTDQRKQGDDHLRIIKTAVKQSLELFGGGLTTGGTSTAYTVATGHVNTPTYKDGHLYAIALHTANGASATINYDAQGARTLKKLNAAGSWINLDVADYPTGTVLLMYYEGGDTTFRIIAASGLPPNAFLPLAGGILSGDLAINKANPAFTLSTGAANELAQIFLQRSNVNRWVFGKTADAESGANAGSDFFVNSYTDAGAFLATVLRIARATALTTFAGTVVSTNGTNGVTLTGNDGGIELLRTTGASYVDFKNSSGDDYDARILQSGTNAALDVDISGTGVTVRANSTGLRSVTTAKAWIFGFYTAGTPGSSQAYNIASITDIGTGQPRFNFTTAMSTVNGCGVTCSTSAGTVGHAAIAVLNTAYTEIQLFDPGHALADLGYSLVMFDGTV